MSKISFILRKTGKGEEQAVSVRHSHKGSDFTKATGVTVHPRYFSLATGKVSSKLPLSPEWNTQIQGVYSDIEKAARNVLSWDEEPTKELISKEYNAIVALREKTREQAPKTIAKVESMIDGLRVRQGELEDELRDVKQQIAELENIFAVGTENLLIQHIEAFINSDEAKDLRPASIHMYRNVIHNLKLWNARLRFNEVTYETLKGFESFLLSKGLKNLSVRAIMVRLKNVVNKYSDKLDDRDSFKKYKNLPKKKNPTIVFLSSEELKELENMKLTDTEESVRDIFVLLAHTGLRWSDRHFPKAAVQKGIVKIVSTKTSSELNIPLSTTAKLILSKYDYKLPAIPQRNFSRVIKTLCSRIETMQDTVTVVDFNGSNVTTSFKPRYEMIAAHSARRTFINLCLIAKTNPAVIRGWVGHNSLEMLMVYADKTANTKEELASVFN